MEFLITKKAKRKAQRIRALNEKKWRGIRIRFVINLVVAMITFPLGYVFYLKYNDLMGCAVCVILSSITLVLSAACIGLLINFTSHQVSSRLNERIWIDSKANTLNHFVQTAFAGGFNYRTADESGNLFVLDIGSIHEAKYDDRSRRIEFKVSGKGYLFADVKEKIIQEESALDEFQAVFYDYTEPSLYETLKGLGVQFEICTLTFKVADRRI